MTEQLFKIGDKVKLEARGTIMIVNEVFNKGEAGFEYECIWHDAEKKPHSKTYKQTLLRKHVAGKRRIALR